MTVGAALARPVVMPLDYSILSRFSRRVPMASRTYDLYLMTR